MVDVAVPVSARIVVMTRDPVPGRVKTRMMPALGAQGAARLHAALVAQTLVTCHASGLPVEVALDGELDGPFAQGMRAGGATLTSQGPGDLGARMHRALRGPGRAICVGTDCPGLAVDDLHVAARGTEIVLGPALDGGYWLVALDGSDEPALVALMSGMTWSTGQVLAQTLERARALGRAVRLLAPRRDLDTPEDLAALAAGPACPPALRALLAPRGR